jgi:hypothetical protein
LSIAVDTAGAAYVTGETFSNDLPTTSGAFDTIPNGGRDAFVTKFGANGDTLEYSTYFGGEGSERGAGVAVDSVGTAFVTGWTNSSDLPTTTGAFDRTFNGVDDAFVTAVAMDGASLVYSTYLGGANGDEALAIVVDRHSRAYVTGATESNNFPTTADGIDRTFNGTADAFLTTFSASGATLAHSTYLGGTTADHGRGIAVDDGGMAYVTGATQSDDFPTTAGAFDTTHGGGWDAFVVKVEVAEPGPDLVQTAVSNPPAVIVLKQKFSVTDSVLNQGSAAVATTTRYYLSLNTLRNAGDKRLGGKRPVPALVAGAKSTGTVSVTVAVTTKLGVYYLLACADDLKVETEDDETNNCRASSTTVEVRAPDLIETAVTSPPETASPGDSFAVTDTVANQGNASAGLTTTRYYLSLDIKKTAKDRLLAGTRAVPALAAGENSAETTIVTIPASTASATYYLLACGDDQNKAVESNETNNCKASAAKMVVQP